MALYAISGDQLKAVQTTTFAQEAILERKHLQAMLRQDTSPLGEDLLVLCEEFGNWQDSNRRIDLLCLDKARNLVVVEIKRTEDGGHMELQAIRYAAMVAPMTLDKAIAAHAQTLRTEDASGDARAAILEFLAQGSVEDAELTGEVRIMLVSADFSTEVTTSVLWLRKRGGLDIRCIRLRPYKMAEQVLIDAAQIIPLPETAEYEVKLRELAEETRMVITKRREIFRRFWAQFIDHSSQRTELFSNRSTTFDPWLSAGIGRAGFVLTATLTEDRARIECFISIGKSNAPANKAAFQALLAQRASIEEAFGSELDWQELPTKSGCRICVDFNDGGWKSPEDEWPAIQAWLTEHAMKLEKALKGPVQALKF
jgi:hypothetical protein